MNSLMPREQNSDHQISLGGPVLVLQEGEYTPVPPTLPVLLHKQGDRVILFSLSVYLATPCDSCDFIFRPQLNKLGQTIILV